MARYFRKNKGLRVSVAILYNYESPRRPKDFVTKEIVYNLQRILKGEFDTFEMDNLFGWRHTVSFEALICLMVETELFDVFD